MLRHVGSQTVLGSVRRFDVGLVGDSEVNISIEWQMGVPVAWSPVAAASSE